MGSIFKVILELIIIIIGIYIAFQLENGKEKIDVGLQIANEFRRSSQFDSAHIFANEALHFAKKMRLIKKL